MRVLFVFPCVGWAPYLHTGIAHMSAVLKAEGHQRRLLYLNDRPGFEADVKAARKAAAQFKPDLVHLSVYAAQLELAQVVACDLKAACGCPVVCGGPHAQAAPDTLVDDGIWDYICVGEGESELRELCRRLAEGRDAADIPGLWALGPDGPARNPIGELEDFASLPAKDYDIFPYQEIIDSLDGRVSIRTRRGASFRYGHQINRSMVDQVRDKGGPDAREVAAVRRRSAEEVIEEIAFLLKAYKNIRMFVLEDDVFTDDKEYVVRFCEAYHEVTNLPLVCNAGPKDLDTETARCLKWAGCRLVRFNPRSGSASVRRMVLKRAVPTDAILKAVAVCRKEGLASSVFVTFGFPGEKLEDIVETVQFLGRAQPDRFRWSAYYPFPGTDLADAAERSGGGHLAGQPVPRDAGSAPVLDFGTQQNLILDKIYTLLPWYVNACSTLPSAPIYDALIRWVDDVPSEAWRRVKEHSASTEESLSSMLNDGHLLHYCYEPGSRTAVRSDAL